MASCRAVMALLLSGGVQGARGMRARGFGGAYQPTRLRFSTGDGCRAFAFSPAVAVVGAPDSARAASGHELVEQASEFTLDIDVAVRTPDDAEAAVGFEPG